MSTLRRRGAIGAAIVTTLAMAVVPSAHAVGPTRTWVSGVGDDANPCSRTAPCKTLAGAISKTDEGGEINAVDSGGFGAVTITKSITIDVRSQLGGVLNSGTTGVIVNAGATDHVVLRGLDIYGSSAGAPVDCGWSGVNGVRILSAGSVTIEDSTITSQQTGVAVQPVAGVNVSVSIADSTISNVCKAGVDATPTGTGAAKVVVTNSLIENTGTGIKAGSGAAVFLPATTLFSNTVALAATGTGSINAYDDTRFVGNGGGETPTALVPSLVPPTPMPSSTPDAAPTPAATAAPTVAPAPTTTPLTQIAKPVVCTVPLLIGKKQAAATKALTDAGCTLGSVTSRKASAARVGKVVAQKRTPGIQLATGAKVGITLGKK